MLRKATAMNVRQNLGELLNEVEYRHDSILITKANKPVAALVDIDLFDKIRRMRSRFDELSQEIADSCQGEARELIEVDIAKALKAARKKAQ
tara:strand:+ start:7944 stop:8219 length:276 start_codon:yes stop_codon:yes gene_type:complete